MTLFRAIAAPLCSVGLLAACTDPVAPPVPSALTVVHGVQEISVPGQRLDTIEVRLTDAQGDGVAGWRVEWSGDGTVVPVDSVTDALGFASAVWTLPRYPRYQDHYGGGGPSGRQTALAEAVGVGTVTLATESGAFVVDAFDASFHYACGIRSRALWCWGGTYSVFGGNQRDAFPQKVMLPAGVSAVDVKTGHASLCIRDEGGYPWCTSRGWNKEFRRISGTPPLRDLTSASNPYGPSGQSVCGLAQADGVPWCWSIEDDVLGLTTRRGARPFETIGLGFQYGCGLDVDGRAWCWGLNNYGQLGNGTGVDSDQPVLVSGDHRFVTLTVGRIGACGSSAAMIIYCWGWDPNSPPTEVPVLITVPGMIGPNIFVKGSGEGYAVVGDQLRIWYSDFALPLFAFADSLRVRQVAGDGQTCVQGIGGDIWCSWILVYGGGDTSPFPSELVPVPDPSSHVP
ncbi:MAG: hypothetical protein ABI542_04110 [Gemmatimonadota bacterium]